MTDLTPLTLTRAQRDAYMRRVRDYEEVSRSIPDTHDQARYQLRLAAALLEVEGFLEMGVFAGDEMCIEASLICDQLNDGFVSHMMTRCHVSAATWRAGK